MSSNPGLRIISWEWAKDIENTPLEKKISVHKYGIERDFSRH